MKQASYGLVFLGLCIVAAAIIIALSSRYSGGPLSEGVTWKLDRMTGRMIYCGITGCIEPKL
jgi:hypothetical protein